MRRYFYWLIMLLLGACNLGAVEDPNYSIQSSYFPLEEGRYVHYNVTERKVAELGGELGGGYDSLFQYQLKEKIGASFSSLEGIETYEMLRYKRTGDEESWLLDSAWYAYVDKGRVVKVEKGLPFIKLLVPPRKGQTWDENAMSELETSTREIIRTQAPYLSEQDTFLNTVVIGFLGDQEYLTIQYADYTGLRSLSQDVYADTVGLVSSNNVDYRFEFEPFTFDNKMETIEGNPFCEYPQSYIFNDSTQVNVPNPFYINDKLECEDNPYFGKTYEEIETMLTPIKSFISLTAGADGLVTIECMDPTKGKVLSGYFSVQEAYQYGKE
ncbi:hypothetical protein V6R21_14260 [Limibacter armeniacum]|uniref:hypothetical protein n=1 Tax=Limibacter armeniacum TaxID=466084 RepID=UPI002FE5E363